MLFLLIKYLFHIDFCFNNKFVAESFEKFCIFYTCCNEQIKKLKLLVYNASAKTAAIWAKTSLDQEKV